MSKVSLARTTIGALLRLLSLSALSILLVACQQGGDMRELENYVQGVVNRPPAPIEPLPTFTAYQSFTYSAAGMRGPFDVPIDIAAAQRAEMMQVEPDFNRSREPLEEFALGTLKMVGTLARNNRLWALIRDETGTIHRLTTGNYLGRNHGRIGVIDETKIELMEIVPSGDGGWIERPQTITQE
jgi:type IV pilus assembly protein PilP